MALESAPDWLGSQATGPGAAFSRAICELTFDEAEALFHLGATPLRGAWTKEVALPVAFEPPQAEALIDIGGVVGDKPVRIALNRAVLR